MGLKIRHRVRGELKGRYFAPGNDGAKNPLRRTDQSKRDEVRSDVHRATRAEASVRSMACVCSAAAAYAMQPINTRDGLYQATYEPITERFQRHLQDLSRRLGREEHGTVVSDHRGRKGDKRPRGHHQKLLRSTGEFASKCDDPIEGLSLEPSHLGVGIRLADLIAGAAWRKHERQDSRWYDLPEPSLRRGPRGEVEGYGSVKMPKSGWR